MMNDPAGAACATDAVRCLYLARVTDRLGHPKAARRWYEKAGRWLETIGPQGQESRMEAKNRSDTTHQSLH